MTVRIGLILSSTVLFTAPETNAPIPTPLLQPSVLYFPTSVGCKWTYTDDEREWSEEVTKVDSTGTVQIVTVDAIMDGRQISKMTYSVSSTELARFDTIIKDSGVPFPLLKLPAKRGDGWKYHWRNGFLDQMKCEGVEEIDVPAGKFKAIVILMLSSTCSSPPSMGIGSTKKEIKRWFVPNVGLVKQVTPSHTLVMTSFSSPKK